MGDKIRFSDATVQAWLRAKGVSGRVTAVSERFVGRFSNTIHQVTVTTDPSDAWTVPLIVKSPRPDRRTKDPGFALELRFYAELSEALPVRTPTFVYGDADAQLLVMEETDWQGISFRDGATPEHLGVAVDAMARLHRWGLGRRLPAWLTPPALQFADAWSRSRESLGTLVPAFVPVGDAMARQLPMLTAPSTLVHGDAHLENLPLVPDGRDVLFLDWADVCVAPPSLDLAFFVVMSLRTEARRQLERGLIARHADRVGDLTIDPIAGYRWGVLVRAARIVTLAQRQPVEEMLRSAGIRLVAQRSLTAAADWF